MAHRAYFRKTVSISGLLKKLRHCFERIPDTRRESSIPIVDYLMSGVAIFGLKYPSLLQFDHARFDEIRRSNLRSLYGIERAPCDTQLRTCLDDIEPRLLRKGFTTLLSALQRAKGLEDMVYLDDHYLVSIDGTGYFSSSEVHCDNCCEKHHRDGRVTYYHQMLGAVLVHPDHKEVFPLAPEPILKQDGSSKNDCERHAAKRLLDALRREHPHLKCIVVEDGLASNGPHIQQLKALDCRYILGAKPSDHDYLFDCVTAGETSGYTKIYEMTDDAGVRHRFRYALHVPLNDTHHTLLVNFLEYWEILPSGKAQHFSWVTDLPLNEQRLMPVMRAGRARWKIENETFNTLKNHGYHFEHNFGHGYKNLSTVMAYLMMLAFLMDQIQQHSCGLFRRAMDKVYSRQCFWEKLRGLYDNYFIPHWQAMYHAIADGLKPTVVPYNTS
jgi:hypothetical protein